MDEAERLQMIKVQHEHEAQWFQGRKELVVRQQSREEGQKKMDEVMYVKVPLVMLSSMS